MEEPERNSATANDMDYALDVGGRPNVNGFPLYLFCNV